MLGLASVTQLYLTERNAHSHNMEAEDRQVNCVRCKQRLCLLHHSYSLSSERVAVQGQALDSSASVRLHQGQTICRLAAVPRAVDSDPVPGDSNRLRQATDAYGMWSHAKQNESS